MRFGIIGAGAIGTLFAGLLTEGGHSVILKTRRLEVAELIQERGIRIEGIADRRINVNATIQPEDLVDREFLMLAVKSYDTTGAVRELKPYLDRKTSILTLQNGLGNIESIKAELPDLGLIGGSTTIASTLLEPGRILWAASGTTVIGEPQGAPTAGTRELARTLSASKIPTHLASDLETVLWTKLLVNAGINPVTALLRITNGEFAENPEARMMASEAVREGERVAEAEGIKILNDPVTEMLRIARMTGSNRSSMLQDVEKQRRTEIDAINGVLVRLGRKHAIPTPVNARLWKAIGSIESQYQINPIKVAA